MSVRNLNWYNLQSTRRYPLDDLAIGEGDENRNNLPNDILVDAHVRYPEPLGPYAYIQGITVSAGIVTVLIGVSGALDQEGATIAALSIPQPATPYVNYPITPLIPGVAGWITIGPGVEKNFSGRYSLPTQTLITQRCARPYRPLPIPSLGKQNLATTLSNEITLVGESPVEVVTRLVDINGQKVNALVVQLTSSDATLNFNPFKQFLGSCGQRPESGTCPKTPIETINGIGPDCDGNIEITFQNLNVKAFDDCGGFDIQTPLTLARVCEPPQPRVFYDDLCCPDEVADIEARNALPVTSLAIGKIIKTLLPEPKFWFVVSINAGVVTWEETTEVNAICGWPDPTTAIPPEVVITLDPLPEYPEVVASCIDFCSCADDPPLFNTRSGAFTVVQTEAPYACAPCESQTAPPTTLEETISVAARNTYAATDSNNTNIAILKTAATDWALGKTISVQLKISGDGLARNGGLVFNYYHDTTADPPQIRYLAAVLDVSRSQLRVLRYTNALFTIEAQELLSVKTNQWYELAVTPFFNGTSVTLNVTAVEISETQNTATINTSVTLANYGALTGTAGLYANRSYTYFNKFSISD